jgi:phosphoglycolate phosphatase-like HAD superfamily hydrolase
MLVVFDVDGTLVGGQAADYGAFDAALRSVAAFRPGPDFWAGLEEVTAASIQRHALEAHPASDHPRLGRQLQAAYLAHLQQAHADNPAAFPATPGAAPLLAALRALPGVDVAIATGDWSDTIRFKLSCAGIDVEGLPLVSSSDRFARSEIIAEAVRRSGRHLGEALYVGDGPWDLKAARQLGIPFVGVGHRRERLTGADRLLATLAELADPRDLAALLPGQPFSLKPR